VIAIRRRLKFAWLYRRGHTPWDSGIVPPEIVAWITAAESRGSPPGRALDLGCGTGTNAIYLAAQGWQTVGVDYVPQAIRQARRKATLHRLAGSVTFAVADVSRRDFLRDAPPFDLVIDIGCLHGLTPDQRASYAAHLIRLTRPGATFLLYAFLPSAASGSRRGIDAAELTALLGPAFEIVDCVTGQDVTRPVGSAWYTLNRVVNIS
jgi:SAM-dependent methyltransferase